MNVSALTASPSRLRPVALAAAGIALLTASSHIAVPFYPVPVTLQTLAVLLIGLACGPRFGAAALAAPIRATTKTPIRTARKIAILVSTPLAPLA